MKTFYHLYYKLWVKLALIHSNILKVGLREEENTNNHNRAMEYVERMDLISSKVFDEPISPYFNYKFKYTKPDPFDYDKTLKTLITVGKEG